MEDLEKDKEKLALHPPGDGPSLTKPRAPPVGKQISNDKEQLLTLHPPGDAPSTSRPRALPVEKEVPKDKEKQALHPPGSAPSIRERVPPARKDVPNDNDASEAHSQKKERTPRAVDIQQDAEKSKAADQVEDNPGQRETSQTEDASVANRTVLRRRRGAESSDGSSSNEEDDFDDDETQAGAVAVYPTSCKDRTSQLEDSMFEDSMFNRKNDKRKSQRERQIDELLFQGELVENTEISEKERHKIEEETAEKMIGTIVHAEALPAADADDSRYSHQISKRKMIFYIGIVILILLLIVGIVVGVVVGGRDGSDNAQSEITATEDGTDQPTSTQPFAPTLAPSILPSSAPSLMPSSGPTMLGDNEDCSEAHPMAVDQIRSGVFLPYEQGATCFFDCASGNYWVVQGRKRWYRYKGEGFPVWVSADSFRVQVYAESDLEPGCWSDQCEDSAVLSVVNPISWIAQDGVEYFIEVICEDECDFYLSDEIAFEIELGRNNYPEGAYGSIVLDEVSFFPGQLVPMYGNSSEAQACGAATAQTTDGAWYKVIGTGNTFTASTCDTTTWDTQISVFRMQRTPSGFNWICIAGNDDACGNGQSSVSWDTLPGYVYHVLVHGKPDQTVGAFTLRLENQGGGDGVNAGDICDTAGSIQTNEEVEVYLGRATDDVNIVDCLAYNVFRAGDFVPTGVWYQIVGTGVTMSLVVDWTERGRFMGVSIRGGPCFGLECVVADCDMGCSWESVAGDTYYIYAYHMIFPYESDDLSAIFRVLSGA